MIFNRRAVIDVGTNSIKLLVADVSANEVRPVLETSQQTRLGRGFYQSARLQPDAMSLTAKGIAEFAALARKNEATDIRVIATSAARDAVNAAELTETVTKHSGLSLEIISGEQEADWAFQGVTSDPQLSRVPLLLVDVGGGSSEFILGEGTRQDFRGSFALGTVRLLEQIPHSDPPLPAELEACRRWLQNFMATEVGPKIAQAGNAQPQLTLGTGRLLVGAGGTTTVLARMEAGMTDYDRGRIEAVRLNRSRVRWHAENLWSQPLAARQKIRGLPPERADVILTGVAIYEAILESLGFSELRVSTRGLRFAAVRAAVTEARPV